MNIIELRDVVDAHMENAKYRLHRLLDDADRPSPISIGSWHNDQGIIVAYVSLNTDQNADNDIEAVVCVRVSETIALTADVCRSDGEVLAKLANTTIEMGEVTTLIAALCKIIEDKIVAYFEKLALGSQGITAFYGASHRAR